MPHDVIFLLVPDFQLLDMSGPAAVFQTAGKQARTAAGPAYAVHVVSERGGPVRSSCGVEVLTRSWRDAPSGTLVVPGGEARARRRHPGHAQVSARASPGRPAPGQRLHGRIRAGGRGPARRAARHHSLASCRRARAQPSGRASRRRPDPRLRWRYVDLGRHYRRHRPRAGDGRIRPGRGGGGRHGARDGGLPPPLGRPVAVLGAAGPGARQRTHPRRAGAHPRESWRGADRRASGRRGCVSPRQFLRSFKAETGETPAKAVERIRRRRRARTSRRAPTVSTASRDGQALPTANGCGGPSCVSTASRRRRCGAWPGKDKKRALFLSLMTPARKARHPAGTACKTKMGIEL